MSTKLHRALFSSLLAASVAVLVAQPAEAKRGTPPPGEYVPSYGEDPEIEAEPDPYADPVVTPNTPTVVPVELGGTDTNPDVATDPGLDGAGDGQNLSPAPVDSPSVLSGEVNRPQAEPASQQAQPATRGVVANTGAETLPLARAGLAALALGIGLVMLARRRRLTDASV